MTPAMSAPASSLASLAPPPPGPLDHAGRVRAGAFAGEVEGASSVAGARSAGARAVRLKRWVYVFVASERAMAGVAIADVGYLGQVFGWAVDRVAERPRVEVEWTAPGALGIRVAGGFAGLSAAGRTFGRRAEIRAEGRGFRVEVELGALRGSLRVESAAIPLTVLSEAGGGSPGATIKAAGLAASGELFSGENRYSFDGASAAVDWTCAYFPYRTDWNWASATGRDAGARAVGLNLCRGVHDAGGHTENALWLDGRPATLPRVRFEVGAPPTAPWRIASDDGAVDLEFRPLGERRADLDYRVVASRFRQGFGTFHGRVRDGDGREASLEGVAGVCEDHHARW
jgi:hypothetical protein